MILTSADVKKYGLLFKEGRVNGRVNGYNICYKRIIEMKNGNEH